MARFNSITARAALGAKGGHAYARLYRDAGYPNLKKALAVSKVRATRTRLRLRREVADLDADWKRIFGITLLDYMLLRQRDPAAAQALLDPPDSPRSQKGK